MCNMIACIGSNNSWLFNGRRVSRDSEIIKDISRLLVNNKLYIKAESSDLFKGSDIRTVVKEENISLGKCEFYFIENLNDLTSVSDIDKLIIYDFGREYPIDISFPWQLMQPMILIDECEFLGKSHNKITRKIFDTELLRIP